MLTIKTIASGSSGNCYWIDDGRTVLMIECGIIFKKIREAFNFQLSGIAGCLISHEHKDHCKAIKDLINAGVDCYLSRGTADATGVNSHRIKIIQARKQLSIGSFQILPFEVQHDVENFGFLLQSGTEKLLFATDTYYIKYKFKGLTHIMIECNYSKKILDENIAAGIVPGAMRHRLLESHFELGQVRFFMMANDLESVREIHLIHISESNGDPGLFQKEIQQITGKPVYI